MKSITSKSLSLMLFFAIAACSKSPPPQSTAGSLTALLPADTFAYAVVDGQNTQIRGWIQSPNYKRYLEMMQASLKSNEALTGDFSTYLATMSALGFMPLNQADAVFPYGESLYFGTVDPTKTFGIGGYYMMAAGTNGKDHLGKVKQILTGKGVAVADITAPEYAGFSLDPFAGMGTIPPGMQVYKDALKIEKIYFGATDSRFVIATSMQLLDAGFAPPKNEAASLLTSEVTKKTLAAVGATSSSPTYGVFDVARLAKATGASESDLAILPTVLIGFNSTMSENGMSVVAAGLVEPRNADHKKFVDSLPAPSKSGLFAKLPVESAIGISVDGTLLRAILETAAQQAPAAQLEMVNQMVAKIEGINLSLAPSNGLTAIPDVSLTLITSDSTAVLETVKSLTALVPVPGAVAWQDAVIEGVPGFSLPTPLVRVQLLATGNVVAASTNADILGAIVKKSSDRDLSQTALVSDIEKGAKSPYLGLFMDYEKFAVLLENSLKSAAAFAQPGQTLPTEQIAAMKFMGKIAIAVGYEPGVARVSMSQEFPKAK